MLTPSGVLCSFFHIQISCLSYVTLPTMNTAGGIILMWDKRVLEKIHVRIGEYSVSCQWRSLDDGFVWTGSGVYGPNLDTMRSYF